MFADFFCLSLRSGHSFAQWSDAPQTKQRPFSFSLPFFLKVAALGLTAGLFFFFLYAA